MVKNLRLALIFNFFLLILLCGVYPLLVTLLGRSFFGDSLSGQLVRHPQTNILVGSKILGQKFTLPRYFHSRPSAIDSNHNSNHISTQSSQGFNYGPTSLKLQQRIKSEAVQLLHQNPQLMNGQIPVDLLTASASGLDPHISPLAAQAQIGRVAQARGIGPQILTDLVKERIQPRQWFIFGEETINVLEINLELDKRFPIK